MEGNSDSKFFYIQEKNLPCLMLTTNTQTETDSTKLKENSKKESLPVTPEQQSIPAQSDNKGGVHWDPFQSSLDPTRLFRSQSISNVPSFKSDPLFAPQFQPKSSLGITTPPAKSGDILSFEDELIKSLSKLGLDIDEPDSTFKSREAIIEENSKNKSITLFKTEMCTTFMNTGSCRYNQKCRFAHGINDLRSVNRHPKYKTQLCKNYYENGACPYGKRCCYLHQSPSEILAANPNGNPPLNFGVYQQDNQVKKGGFASTVYIPQKENILPPILTSPNGRRDINTFIHSNDEYSSFSLPMSPTYSLPHNLNFSNSSYFPNI